MAKRLAFLSLVVVFAGCAGGEEGSAPKPPADANALEQPDAFFKRLLGYELAGQFGKSWDMLHPGHQALVTRAKYASCSADDFGATSLASVETVDVYDQPIDVRDVPQKTSKAVTLKLTLAAGETQEATTHTFHAVRIADRWAWYFGDAVIDAYKLGDCP
jgi:hypothetical protein